MYTNTQNKPNINKPTVHHKDHCISQGKTVNSVHSAVIQNKPSTRLQLKDGMLKLLLPPDTQSSITPQIQGADHPKKQYKWAFF